MMGCWLSLPPPGTPVSFKLGLLLSLVRPLTSHTPGIHGGNSVVIFAFSGFTVDCLENGQVHRPR